MKRTAFLVLGMIPALIGFVRCGSGVDSPTSPSRGTATIQGMVNPSGAATSGQAHSLGRGATIRITVMGTGLTTTTDSRGNFVLTGVPTGTVTLQFEGPGIDARLEISGLQPGQVLTINVEAEGSKATLLSTTPGATPSPSPSPTKETELTGKIESITPPKLTVAGHTVLTDSSTHIEKDGKTVSLSALVVGDVVNVEGFVQPDGSILATQIEVEQDEQEGVETELTGKIESINPPNLMVSGKTVHTDAHTEIEENDKAVSLSALKVGQTVEVEGLVQADGSILARKIKVEEAEDGEGDED